MKEKEVSYKADKEIKPGRLKVVPRRNRIQITAGQNMKSATMQATIEATKAVIMELREAYNLVIATSPV